MLKVLIKRLFSSGMLFLSLTALTLTACNNTIRPPFNDFKGDAPNAKGTGSGAGYGAIAGVLLGPTVIGAIVGGTAGTVSGYYRTNKATIVRRLKVEDTQFIEYGDTKTLIVPTDHYFMFNSAQINDICYQGLNDMVRLIRLYPHNCIYVAGFTDNVGSKRHKLLLSQARAEAMVTFLWANGIPAQLLKAQGYGDHFPIGDNFLIRGSAFNRRLEIQWSNQSQCPQQGAPLQGTMK